MPSESSLIAKKIRDLVIIQNQKSQYVGSLKEPGIIKNFILVSLLGAAVFLTSLTLLLVNCVKKFEH
jgi:hypothetical protein